MAYAIIYAEGHSEDNEFSINSSWAVTYNAPTSSMVFISGPTVGYSTWTYLLDSIPAGAKINYIDAYVRVGARFDANTGTKSGYPKANNIRLQRVVNLSEEEKQELYQGDTQDANLYVAKNVASSTESTIKISYAFQANGNVNSTGSGSLSFDNAFILVDYIPPCSDWVWDSITGVAGETLTGHVVLTTDNAEYVHRISLAVDGNEIFTTELSPGTASFAVMLDKEWLKYFPNTLTGKLSATLHTYDKNHTLLGSSDPVEIEIVCPENMVPDPGSLEEIGQSKFDSLYIQGVSSVSIISAGWKGIYGSSVQSVSISGNGKNVTKHFDYNSSGEEDCVLLDSGLQSNSGDIDFSITVTDTRGRTSVFVKTIKVYPYSPVKIISTAQGRISNTEPDALDTGYLKVNYQHTPITSSENTSNIPVLTIYCDNGSTVIDNYASGMQCSFLDDGLLKNLLYTVTISLTDGITTTTAVRTIGTAHAFMRWDPKNNAVGFGCYPQESCCVQVADNWKLIAGDIYVGNQSIKALIQSLKDAGILMSGS